MDKQDKKMEETEDSKSIPKKRKKRSCLGNVFFWALRILLLLVITGGVCGLIRFYPTFSDFYKEAKDKVGNSTEETFHPNESSYIYDKDGNVLAKLRRGGDSAYLTYDEIPQAVVNAFVAVEDQSFWSNPGIDMKGILRISVDFVLSKGKEKHGASTITQQLARTIFLTQEKTLERKGKEILMAMMITNQYSKEQIMEFYINNIYFANGYYGIEAAAKGYFGKSVSELSLSQMVYLCAIPNRPSYYDPFENPENALKRRNKILNDMNEQGYITEEESKEAQEEEIAVSRTTYALHNYETTYAIHCATEALMQADEFEFQYHFDSQEEYEAYLESYEEEYDLMKTELYTGGYQVYTSIDRDMQDTLQKVLDDTLSFDQEKTTDGIYQFQGAATVIDNETGKVAAIVGGRSQEEAGTYSLNRAFQSYRQPGSTIKPLIVYAPALQLGYLPNSQLQEISVSQAKQVKKKAVISQMTGERYTLRRAVELSKNGCAYHLFNGIGVKYGLSFIESMHFTKIVPSDYSLSAALGGLTYGTTTAQMASGYAALANYGEYREETCITSIKKSDGTEKYTDYSARIYDTDSAKTMLDILAGVMTNGTGRPLHWNSGVEAIGKTGTTNDSKDGWFCGATPYYTIAVWCGYDTPRTLDSLYGGSYPGQIWKKAMESYVSDLPDADFEDPENEIGQEEYLYWLSDDYILSAGYTAGNYRTDFGLRDRVRYLTEKMKVLDKNSPFYEENLKTMCDQAQAMIRTIYGTKATLETQKIFDDACMELFGHTYVPDQNEEVLP
ncbi:MAG: penicillin-binding protein [Lachnospiraceae bacterium]|nr:penicillin-binding protein [Lachnospiraceae bacterium]